MRVGFRVVALCGVLVGLAVSSVYAQGDPDRVIPNGGIFIQGWTGKIDAQSAAQGRELKDGRLAQEGNVIHVTTGPATTFWNPANKAAGDYTVKATFTEPKYMNLNSHPHSYGIMPRQPMGSTSSRRSRRRISAASPTTTK